MEWTNGLWPNEGRNQKIEENKSCRKLNFILNGLIAFFFTCKGKQIVIWGKYPKLDGVDEWFVSERRPESENRKENLHAYRNTFHNTAVLTPLQYLYRCMGYPRKKEWNYWTLHSVLPCSQYSSGTYCPTVVSSIFYKFSINKSPKFDNNAWCF